MRTSTKRCSVAAARRKPDTNSNATILAQRHHIDSERHAAGAVGEVAAEAAGDEGRHERGERSADGGQPADIARESAACLQSLTYGSKLSFGNQSNGDRHTPDIAG